MFKIKSLQHASKTIGPFSDFIEECYFFLLVSNHVKSRRGNGQQVAFLKLTSFCDLKWRHGRLIELDSS